MASVHISFLFSSIIWSAHFHLNSNIYLPIMMPTIINLLYSTRTAESLEWWLVASCYIHLSLMFEIVSFFFFFSFLLFLLSFHSIWYCYCLSAIRFGFHIYFPPLLLCVQHVAATGETTACLCVFIFNFSPHLKRLFSTWPDLGIKNTANACFPLWRKHKVFSSPCASSAWGNRYKKIIIFPLMRTQQNRC